MVWAAISLYSIGPIISLHGKITSREYVDDAPIHTAGSVQSWFEEHEGELQYLAWPAQSTH
jgi:hypothetical protein